MTFFIFAGDMLVMLFMIILVVWVFWHSSEETITESSRIPLEDEKPHE
jgi:cbb3-type cytochrome oxidase subunit 3